MRIKRIRHSSLFFSKKGQISFLIALLMTTLFLFFAFVVHVGMLVNAKINLQNAADLAAYAGASVQARQLNTISYLNYEMRRQWKKFLFRLYVLGNMAQDSFPRDPGSTGAMIYQADTMRNSENYGVPATCVIFNSNNNTCHLSVLTGIEIPPETFLDAINDTLRDQMGQIEKIRQDGCKNLGQTNLMLNILWLYNTDPDFKQLSTATNLSAQQMSAISVLQALAHGLGIVPKELILRFRLKSMEEYLNSPPLIGLNKSQIDSFLNKQDPNFYERSIQAFYSAYYTLGNHTFSGENITLDELLPGNSSSARLISLQDIKQTFDTYIVALEPENSQFGVAGDTSMETRACKASLVSVSVQQGLPLGVFKDPTVLTYYAVRLKAKARLLFSPFGDMELKAYAAAQPFGSRIGPSADNVSFVTEKSPLTSSVIGFPLGKIPNLSIQENDSIVPPSGRGWDSQEMNSLMFQFLIGGGTALKDTETINAFQMESAYIPAMAPNPWEITRYNIINDQGQDAFMRHFGEDHITSLWAPVFRPEKTADLSLEIESELSRLFESLGTMNTNGLQNIIQQGLLSYISSALPQGAGEEGEGLNIIRIHDPFDFNKSMASPVLLVTDEISFKTSWNKVGNARLEKNGRVGYSVKFISFDALSENKLPTNGQTTWSNNLPRDSETEQDLPFLKH